MSNISMVEAKLPPGFRFHPRDDELISHYLMKKVTGNYHHHRHDHQPELVNSPLLIEVDLNKCEPWDLSELACVGGKNWYFYSQRDRKYATGLRTNRATASGYWKATGKDRAINRQGSLVGMRKTLVFYQGRAPKGTKTDWVMHEFRLQGPFGPPKIPPNKEDWVLCRVFYKSKEGPTKSSMDTRSSLSLPPLTDSYNIDFKSNQTCPTNHINGHGYDQQEQVPCFSIFPTNHSSHTNTFSSHDEHMDHQLPSTTMVEMGGGCGNLDPFSRDKKVIEAVLDQYFKIECDGTNGGGDGSFLSEVGMPNILNLS